MALDKFSQCPCGSGKKVKFCCSADVIEDLQKAARALEGEQRMAAIDQLSRILAKHPECAAALALKAAAQIQLGELSAAEETVLSFLRAAPGNPVAFAQSAMLDAVKGQLQSAVEQLQRAMSASAEQLPYTLYEAIGVVAESLLIKGEVLAARGHFLLQSVVAGTEDARPTEMLMRINSSPQLPLLLKEELLPGGTIDDSPESEPFKAAMVDVNRGAWTPACEKFAAIADSAEGGAEALHWLAVLHSWLGQHEEAVKAWRRYAASDGLPLDDAVESEAFAQLLDRNTDDETIDVVKSTFPVTDTEKLMEQLLASRRASQMPIDTSQLGDDDQPPPKAVFWLLDRDVPETGVGITREQTPQVWGELYLFGKQTDREARVEFVSPRTDDFSQRASAAKELLGEFAGPVEKEEATDTVSAAAEAMAWKWRLPDDTPPETRAALMEEQRRENILNRWPHVKSRALGGKTPAEAAGDPQWRKPVLAAILQLEQSGHRNRWRFDFNELREKLGLPKSEPIDPAQVEVDTLPLVRLFRVVAEKLNDDDLIGLLHRASLVSASQALYNLAHEVIRRGPIEGKIEKTAAYDLLARTAYDAAEAVDAIRQAQAEMEAQGESPVRFLLEELNIHLQSGTGVEAEKLLRRIQTRHANEPGVARALLQLLASYGLVSPDGTPMPAQAAPEPAVAGAAAGADAGKLVLPGEAAAPAAEGEQKSKLWLPGMD